jgi:hypothetical protein
LETALREALFPPGSPRQACQRQGGARYIFNRIDLDGDRQPETLVALLGQRRCGREGCPLLLLKSDGPRLVPFQRVMGLRSSLVVSERRNHGWLDLILPPDAEGSAGPPLRLTHDGAAYATAADAAAVSASSPATAPAAGVRAAPVPLTLGVSALSLRTSPWLVQGHALPCPAAAGRAPVPEATATSVVR